MRRLRAIGALTVGVSFVLAGIPAGAAGGTVVPAPVTTAPPAGYPSLIGAGTDGSYAVQERERGGITFTVVSPDGSTVWSRHLDKQPAVYAAGFLDGTAWWSTTRTSVTIAPLAGGEWTTQLGTAHPVGVAGASGVLTQSTSGDLAIVDRTGTATVLASALEKITSAGVDHTGGLLLGASGTVYRLDLATASVRALAGLGPAWAVGGSTGTDVAVTKDGTVVRVARDGSLGSPVPLPDRTDSVSQVSANATSTFVSGGRAGYVGPAAGPLHAIAFGGFVAADGNVAYTDADGRFLRVRDDTSPPPTATIDTPIGARTGRVASLATHTDEDDTKPSVSTYWVGPAGLSYDLASVQLPVGRQTVQAVASGATGVGSAVTSTVTVVAHPVSVVLGTDRHVYEQRGTAGYVSFGGVGFSAPAVTSTGTTDVIVVEGADQHAYIRTDTTGWRLLYGGLCTQPGVAYNPNGSSYLVVCGGPNRVVQEARFRLDATGSPVDLQVGYAPRTTTGIVGRAAVGADSRYVFTGTDGRLYLGDYGATPIVGNACAGPIGGGSAALDGTSAATVYACARKDGALLVGASPSSMTAVGGYVTGVPAVAAQSDGTAVITVAGAHGELYRTTWDGTRISGFARIAGGTAGGGGGTWTDGA